MKLAKWLQETRLMRFEEAYEAWAEKRLIQEEAAQLLGGCPRTCRRRHIENYHEDSLDRRLEQASYQLALTAEAIRRIFLDSKVFCRYSGLQIQSNGQFLPYERDCERRL